MAARAKMSLSLAHCNLDCRLECSCLVGILPACAATYIASTSAHPYPLLTLSRRASEQ